MKEIFHLMATRCNQKDLIEYESHKSTSPSMKKINKFQARGTKVHP